MTDGHFHFSIDESSRTTASVSTQDRDIITMAVAYALHESEQERV